MEENNMPEDLSILFDNVEFDITPTPALNMLNMKGKSSRPTHRFDHSANVDNFLAEQENLNTKRKTFADVACFQAFLKEFDEERVPEMLPVGELNHHLCTFLLAVRKQDGEEYEPSSLRSYVSSLDRHLQQKGYAFKIMESIEFSKTRQTLKSKMKHLKKQGKGNKPKAAHEISDDNIDEMYEVGNLGGGNPQALINSMWMICTLNFGMRTGQEVHNMKWGDVQVLKDENGDEYITLNQERQTKTRTGESDRNIRQLKPRAYSLPETSDTDRDPIGLYRQYASHRPEEMMSDDSPFFLAVNYQRKLDSPWFKRSPLGINKIYAIMKSMKTGTRIQDDPRITPYSMRKHLVQKLRDTGLPPTEIIQVTGHKNVNSINNYSSMSETQQKKVSHVLSTNLNKHKQDLPLVPVPTSTVSRPRVAETVSRSDSMPPASQGSVYSETNSRSILSSLLYGNTIHGNVTINVTPEALGMSRPQTAASNVVDSPHVKRARLDFDNSIE